MTKKKKLVFGRNKNNDVLSKEWVFSDKGNVFTDTLTIAEVFSKEHKTVLRDVRGLTQTTSDFGENNFVPCSYTSEQNKKLPKYLLTEDGFMLLVMGYTGQAAMRFKIEFIRRFKAMKAELTTKLPGAVKQYLELSENERAIKFFQQRMELDTAKKEVKEAKPKVEFHDKFVDAEGLQVVSEVAKVLGTGSKRFFTWLREEKILQSTNKPYQLYVERGYFKLKEFYTGDKKSGHTVTLVTPKGVSYLAKRYLEAGCPMNK